MATFVGVRASDGNGKMVSLTVDVLTQPPRKSTRSDELYDSVSGKRNLKKLKSVLDSCNEEEEKQLDLIEVDDEYKTILHRAVMIRSRENARTITAEILHHCNCEAEIKLIDMQDIDKNTALHLAVESGREKIATILLRYKPILENKNKPRLLGKVPETALELIQNRMPKLLRFQYDAGVRWVDDEQEQILLNFNKTTESHYDFETVTADELDKHKESNNFRGILKGRSENFDDLLNHPLVQVFVYLKYKRAYPFIMISIFGHVLWHAIYAYFIFKIYYTNCPWKPTRNDTTSTKFYDNSNTTIECARENLETLDLVLGVVCWLLGAVFIAKEVVEIIAAPSKFRYFLEFENIGQIYICISVILTSWPVYEYLGGATTVSINPWQYKISAGSVFVVWALVLGQICKIQELRIYIEIFLKVIKSFAMFICTFASLLFAFAFSFCIMMPEGKAFTSPWLAVPKVLVMMTGELNYDDVFYGEEGSGSSPEHYFTTQILFSLFTILMSMILLNMLIGLAVNDTQELRHQSHIAELFSILHEVFLMESFAFRLHKKLNMPWLLKRLSINQDTQHQLNDPLTLCLFGKSSQDDKENMSMTGISIENISSGKIKVERGLFYNYNTTKRNEEYPFAQELMSKLINIADGKNNAEENQLRQLKKLLSKVPLSGKDDFS